MKQSERDGIFISVIAVVLAVIAVVHVVLIVQNKRSLAEITTTEGYAGGE